MRLLAYHTAANRLRTVRIDDVKTESPTVKTFAFRDSLCSRARPGQFLMLWIPGIDEIPLSIAGIRENGSVTVTVKDVGEATHAMHSMGRGEPVGIRGPFGNSFSFRNGKVLMVGGGTGIAPLLFLANRLKLISHMSEPTFLIGAKTGRELQFMEDLEKVCKTSNILATTEDGSCGAPGLCTDLLDGLLTSATFDFVYACGPEKMIFKAFEMAERRKVGFEASLERLMRCAIGLCGSCVIGKYRVCRDGPVFTGKQLMTLRAELGRTKLDFDGRRIPI